MPAPNFSFHPQERAVTQVLDGSSLFGERVENESRSRLQESKETSSPARTINRAERNDFYQDSPSRHTAEEIVHQQVANRLSNEPISVSPRDRHERRSGSEDSEGASAGVGLVIGNELLNPDPVRGASKLLFN